MQQCYHRRDGNVAIKKFGACKKMTRRQTFLNNFFFEGLGRNFDFTL
jgi:hypothetical protein